MLFPARVSANTEEFKTLTEAKKALLADTFKGYKTTKELCEKLLRTKPYPEVRATLARKVVSELGRVDYLRVRLVDGKVEPLTARGAGVLSTTTRADGFVVVPRDVEGWPEGAEVAVRLYDVL